MTVTIQGAPDSDQAELEELTLQLRTDLLELEVDRVELVRSWHAPEGAKPGDVVALGALALTVSPMALRGVLRLLEVWITSRPVRKVRVVFGDDSIELERASRVDQRRLVDAFIEAHRPSPGSWPERHDGTRPEADESLRPEAEEASSGF